MHALHVIISGTVQGVGFRFSTQREARRLDLTGWVSNQPDGTVEAEFFGPRSTLEDMLAWCRRGPRGAKVREVQAEWREAPPDEQPPVFSIRG